MRRINRLYLLSCGICVDNSGVFESEGIDFDEFKSGGLREI